jgi:hypothetical protein
VGCAGRRREGAVCITPGPGDAFNGNPWQRATQHRSEFYQTPAPPALAAGDSRELRAPATHPSRQQTRKCREPDSRRVSHVAEDRPPPQPPPPPRCRAGSTLPELSAGRISPLPSVRDIPSSRSSILFSSLFFASGGGRRTGRARTALFIRLRR